jgi:Mrp family chromosome partitioning ATPase
LSVESAAARLTDSARLLDAGCDFISISATHARSASAAAITLLYQTIRAHYDYAVVDAGIISGGGLPFARNADGVVLALRDGRAISEADREIVDVFGRLHVHFLGVVATSDRGTPKGAASRSLYERLQPRPRARPISSEGEERPTRGVALAQPTSSLTRLSARSDG